MRSPTDIFAEAKAKLGRPLNAGEWLDLVEQAQREAIEEAAKAAKREAADLAEIAAGHARLGDDIERSYFHHSAEAVKRAEAAIRALLPHRKG